jgi:hypothetical protein
MEIDMPILNVKYHQDPAHGWIEVDLMLMAEVGMKASDVSAYSYVNGTKFYLEEDCDAGKFMKLAEAAGYQVKLHDIHYAGDAPMRSMNRFKLVAA